MLIGIEGQKRLCDATVAIFGVGGVGGYAAEAIARAGVGEIDLIDSDAVSVSNINRQIIALHSNVGESKVEVMRKKYGSNVLSEKKGKSFIKKVFK